MNTCLAEKLPVLFLKPAELCISEKPLMVETVLGSCVAVTMFHKRLGIAAICHAVAPSPPPGSMENGFEKFKYVDLVIQEMVTRLLRYGIKPPHIEVKIFGGSEIIGPRRGQKSQFNIGQMNVQTALAILEAMGLKIQAMNVGGATGRKIYFNTQTGEVLLKRIKKTSPCPFCPNGIVR